MTSYVFEDIDLICLENHQQPPRYKVRMAAIADEGRHYEIQKLQHIFVGRWHATFNH